MPGPYPCPKCGKPLDPKTLGSELDSLTFLMCAPCKIGHFEGDRTREGADLVDLSAPNWRENLTYLAHEVIRWRRFMESDSDDPIFSPMGGPS